MPGILEGIGILAIAVLAVFLAAVVCIFGMAFYVLLKIITNMN